MVEQKGLLSLILIALVIGGLAFYLFIPKANDPEAGKVNQQGLCVPEGRAGIGFATCCFDQNENSIECKPSPNQQAIFNNQAGVFFVAYGVSLTNQGNVVYDSAKIKSVSVSPLNSELSNKFNTLVNMPSTNVIPSQTIDWSTPTGAGQKIDLSKIPTGIYTITVTGEVISGTQTKTDSAVVQLNVEQEELGFSLNINQI